MFEGKPLSLGGHLIRQTKAMKGVDQEAENASDYLHLNFTGFRLYF